jgi:hypothetical protein
VLHSELTWSVTHAGARTSQNTLWADLLAKWTRSWAIELHSLLTWAMRHSCSSWACSLVSTTMKLASDLSSLLGIALSMHSQKLRRVNKGPRQQKHRKSPLSAQCSRCSAGSQQQSFCQLASHTATEQMKIDEQCARVKGKKQEASSGCGNQAVGVDISFFASFFWVIDWTQETSSDAKEDF